MEIFPFFSIFLAHKAWMSSRVELQRTASKTKEGFIPRMHRFYHMEYFLLPDDTEPRKLDLVLFGPVAKLFLEAESKVRKDKQLFITMLLYN